jgi:hypothetical protein
MRCAKLRRDHADTWLACRWQRPKLREIQIFPRKLTAVHLGRGFSAVMMDQEHVAGQKDSQAKNEHGPKHVRRRE